MMFRIAFLVLTVTAVGDAGAYEINNHADMSETAALKSVLTTSGGANGKLFRLGLKPFAINSSNAEQTFPLTSGLPEIRKCFGELEGGGQELGTSQPLWGVDSGRTQLQIAQLFRYGACYEDNTSLDGVRPLAHFYDPQHNGRGLTVSTGAVGPSSVAWALNPSASGSLTGVNHYGWLDAREFFYEALTYKSDLASVSAADNELFRKIRWAKTFQSVGHIVHHLQDMAQPQHVRNDQHCDKLPCTVLGSNKESGYEKFWQGRADTIRALAATATIPILFGLPREFWNATLNAQLQAPNLSAHMPQQSGLAAYTSSNFVSAGTDFTIERDGSTRTPLPNYDFDLPRPSLLPNDVNLATLFDGATPTVREAVRTKVCGGDLLTCKMRFYGSEVDPGARTSSISYFSQEYLGAATTPTRGRAGYFTQNYWTYADAATKLIPKAVEYSAGLINYFFRGEMEISLPDEGVYGIVDHSVEKDKGVHGFRFIKMKVKNTTQDINSARGAIAQNMTNGQFFAVAKFHRNACYTADLKGQIGMPGIATSCRSSVEEIAVSNPETLDLAAGALATISFEFASPIPIEATDLFLQVVFKGTLGEEVGAVAVTTKDVSEPTFFGYANMIDYAVCSSAHFSGARCDGVNDFAVDAPISDLVTAPFVPTIPANLTPPTYGGSTRSWPSVEWLSFSRVHPSYKVARLPVAGIMPGQFVRMGIIADIDQTPGMWGNMEPDVTYVWPSGLGESEADAPFVRSRWLNRNDLPIWYPISCQGGSTSPSLSFDTGRVRAVEVQADETGVLDPARLPRYHSLRQTVLGVRADRAEDPDEFGFMATYTDEGTRSSGAQQNVTRTPGYEHSSIHRFSDQIAATNPTNTPPLTIVAMHSAGLIRGAPNRVVTINSEAAVELDCGKILNRHGYMRPFLLPAWKVNKTYLSIPAWGP